jgi:hypothetical protein
VHGILNAEGGGELFADTIGNWRVRIVQIVPLQAETISVSAEGGAVGGGVPTASQVAEAVWSTANIKRLLGLILGLR